MKSLSIGESDFPLTKSSTGIKIAIIANSTLELKNDAIKRQM
jgi:hypothetical protein